MAKQLRSWRWAVALGVALPLAAAAAWLPVRSGSPHQLPAGQRFAGDYAAVGERIEIAGDVDGDVMVVASRVTISGNVSGDVLALASDLALTGDVAGDVRVAALTVSLGGAVGKNLNVWAGQLALTPTSSVGRNALIGSDALKLQGTINGALAARGGTVVLDGSVAGPATVALGEHGTLTIGREARVNGDLTYLARSPEQLLSTTTAPVTGVVKHQPFVGPTPAERWRTEIFGRLVSLFGLLVVGLVLVTLAPRWCLELAELMQRRQPWLTLAWGVIGFLAVPVGAVALVFTVIGMPLALIVAVLYLVGMYVAQAVAGIVIGVSVLQRFGNGRWNKTFLPSMVVGMTLLVAVSSFGPAGWLARLAAALWAFGAILRSAGQALPRWRS